MRTLLEMARAAQHDDRQSTGKLYGDLADRIDELEAALEKIIENVETGSYESTGQAIDIARAALRRK